MNRLNVAQNAQDQYVGAKTYLMKSYWDGVVNIYNSSYILSYITDIADLCGIKNKLQFLKSR